MVINLICDLSGTSTVQTATIPFVQYASPTVSIIQNAMFTPYITGTLYYHTIPAIMHHAPSSP